MDSTIITSLGFRQPISSISHWLGFVWMLYITALLCRLSRDQVILRRALTCFGLCASTLYGISALYHTVSGPDSLIQFLRRLDFSAIFLLIAGTWTALFVVLPSRLRLRMWLLVWSIAVLGIASKWLLPMTAYPLTLALYGLLALLGLVPFRALLRNLGGRGLLLGILGGLCYLIGGVCDVLKWPILIPGVIHSHEVLHFFDLIGTAIHVRLMFYLITQSNHNHFNDHSITS